MAHSGAASRRGWLGAVLVLAIGCPAGAAPDNAVPEQRKDGVAKLIALMGEALKDCKDVKLEDYFGTGAGQITYEQVDGKDPTFGDAIALLKKKLDNGELVEAGLIGLGQVITQDGTVADRIRIRRNLFQEPFNELSSFDSRIEAKLQAMATLANEIVHVYQHFGGASAGQRCDAEADSDSASIKVLQAIQAAITKDNGSGEAHAALADLDTDAQAIRGLKACLMMVGASTPAHLATTLERIKGLLGTETSANGYVRRRKAFQDDITNSRDWSEWYGGGRDGEPSRFTMEEEVSRSGFYVTSLGGTSTALVPVPPGESIVFSIGFTPPSRRPVFVGASGDALGNRWLRFFRDSVGSDELPEVPAASTVALSPGPPAVPPLDDIAVLFADAEELRSPTAAAAIFVFDRTLGEISMLDLDGNGLPAGPRRSLALHADLARPSIFDVLVQDLDSPVSNHARLVVAPDPKADHLAVWFDIPIFGGAAIPSVAPGQTVAQGLDVQPTPRVMVASTSPSQPVVLGGAAGSIVSLSSIGQGAETHLGSASVGALGASAPFFPLSPLQPNDLLLVDDSLGRHARLFLPRIGSPISTLDADVDVDGAQDTLVLSSFPSRVHLVIGSLSDPPQSPVRTHVLEIALEPDNYGGLSVADAAPLFPLVTLEPSPPLRVLSGFIPPHLVQRAVDFDGDMTADEALVLARPTSAPGFQAKFISSIGGAAATDQVLSLPPGFEPDRIEYVDLQANSRLDVRLRPLGAGITQCLMNSGGPPAVRFSLTPCAACPGDADGSGAVSFADVTTVLVNFGATYLPTPGTGIGDANLDGVVNFGDVTAVLVNFGFGCS